MSLKAEKKAEEAAKKIVENFLSSQEHLDFGKPSFPYIKKESSKRKKRGEADAEPELRKRSNNEHC
jgi:hypothetical protein